MKIPAIHKTDIDSFGTVMHTVPLQEPTSTDPTLCTLTTAVRMVPTVSSLPALKVWILKLTTRMASTLSTMPLVALWICTSWLVLRPRRSLSSTPHSLAELLRCHIGASVSTSASTVTVISGKLLRLWPTTHKPTSLSRPCGPISTTWSSAACSP